MQRSNSIRRAIACLSGLITLILTAGCGHHTASVVPPSAAVTTAAVPTTTPPAAFQPYTLLPPPPPAPPVAAPRHRVLHLTRVHNRVYLADSERHLYEAGRDPQGHIYPIYRDPATRVTYPLYYDPSRDNLYRLARQQDGHFYRNYVGQPADRFYDTDRDYERIIPGDNDRPIVTDSYNTYNYNTYNYGPNSGSRYSNSPGYSPYFAGYRPPVHHTSHFNNNWLWAIPVIVGAYLLLQPHHHSPPHPVYSHPNTTVVNQITRINIVNQITQAAPVGYRPLASPRPVYLYPPGYTPQAGFARPDVHPHGPVGPVIAAPVAVAAVRAAALAHPAWHSPLPMPNSRPTSFTPRPVPPVRPMLRPRVQQARAAAPISASPRPVPTTFHRHSASLPVGHPPVRRAEFVRPRLLTPRRQVRALERPRVEPPRVIRLSTPKPEVIRPRPVEHVSSVERSHLARRSPPVAQPVEIMHTHVPPAPRREEVHSAPRVEHIEMHSVPPVEHSTIESRRLAPPHPAVRPRVVRSAPPARKHEARTGPIAMKKESRPSKPAETASH